jgi:hypothetical protein
MKEQAIGQIAVEKGVIDLTHDACAAKYGTRESAAADLEAITAATLRD